MLPQMTDRARKVLVLAAGEAKRFGHDAVGDEHLLLGLLKEGTGMGAAALRNLGVGLPAVRTAVERNSAAVTGCPGLKHAAEEARRLRHNYIGTEHLLLGLLRDRGATAAQILGTLDVSLDRLRSEVLALAGIAASPIQPANDPDEAPDDADSSNDDADLEFDATPDPEGDEHAPASSRDHETAAQGYERFLKKLDEWKEQAVRDGIYELAAVHRDAARAVQDFLERLRKERRL